MAKQTEFFELRRTNFHASNPSSAYAYEASYDVISRHRTVAAAIRAKVRYLRGETCGCGCVVIVSTDGRDLAREIHDADPVRLW